MSKYLSTQRTQMTACKKAILDEWLEEVVTVFRKTAENGVFTSVPALVLQRFFDSLSVLMSNCTRHVVMESLRVLLRFFRRYAPPDSSNANSDGRSRLSYAYAETKSYRCAFVLPATIYNLPPPMVRASDTDKKNPATTATTDTTPAPPPRIGFLTELSDIESSILKLFDDVVKSFNGITRVDQRIHLSSQGITKAGITASYNNDAQNTAAHGLNSDRLFEVNKEEQDIVALRAELSNILQHNLYSPHQPKQSLALFFNTYKPYHSLLRQRQTLPLYFQQSLQKPGSVTLDDYSKKITTFLELAEKIKLDAKYRETNQPMEKEGSAAEEGQKRPAAGTQAEKAAVDAKARRMGSSSRATGVNANRVVRGMVLVDCTGLNQQLVGLAEESALSILEHLADDLVARSHGIKDDFKQIMNVLNRRPTTSQELVAAEEFLHQVDTEDLDNLLRDVGDIKRRLDFLFEHNYDINDFVLVPVGVAFSWSRKINAHLNMARTEIQRDRDSLEQQLKQRKQLFASNVDAFATNVEDMTQVGATMDKSTGTIKDIAKIKNQVDGLREEETTLTQEAEDLNSEEDRLGWPLSDFEALIGAKKMFVPFYKLWGVAYHYSKAQQRWRKGPVCQLNAEEVEKTIGDMWREVYKLGKQLEDLSPLASKMALEIKLQLDQLKHDLPLLTAVCNPGLRQRHWNQMTEHVGFTLGADASMSMFDLLKMGAGDSEKVLLLSAVSEQARKEWSIEKNLKAMRELWTHVSYSTSAYKDTGTHVLQGGCVEEIQLLLDDHTIKTQTMRSSPYAKPLVASLKAWEDYLRFTSALLEEWLKMQSSWLYLEPIFSSEDIKTQMPGEAAKFQTVDDLWREHMTQANASPRAVDMAKRSTLLETLVGGNVVLDEIQKGLSAYLETKRLRFPRFFFLADEELLEILAETKDPLRVQPFLKKIFDGLHSLAFETSHSAPEGKSKTQKRSTQQTSTPKSKKYATPGSTELKITGIGSSEGEKVKILSVIRPAEAKGAVEKWLLQVESMMRLSVQDVVEKAVEDYSTRDRNEWVLNWPGQAVLCVSQLYWTTDFERYVKDQHRYTLRGDAKTAAAANAASATGAANAASATNDNHSRTVAHRGGPLVRYKEQLEGYVSDIVALVRGTLTKLQRKTLSALIIMDVHAKDVVEKLVQAGVTSSSAFDWQSQLRYYWEEDQRQHREEEEELETDPYAGMFEFDNTLYVKMIASTLVYGYEYLGNSGRLVITPLTDRCYRTLMGAIHLNYGGAPEGPAGTGKTETTKDLSKALAQQCVVYNCSDQLDHLAMAKFFKGLASAGAWACFDEFNRITLEVLSVVAQQVTTIQLATKAKQKRFVFSGTELSLKLTCNVFITMNPGYAGRAELPDNLKVLFRTVAMMVPDYAMIAEIILYSNGFLDSRSLSVKIVTTYTLCSEQLSTQSHYDYGMRAVMAVLRAAGNLKRKLGDTLSEDVLVLRAIKDVNVAKFLSQDLILFDGITSDLFPGVTLPPPQLRTHVGRH